MFIDEKERNMPAISKLHTKNKCSTCISQHL